MFLHTYYRFFFMRIYLSSFQFFCSLFGMHCVFFLTFFSHLPSFPPSLSFLPFVPSFSYQPSPSLLWPAVRQEFQPSEQLLEVFPLFYLQTCSSIGISPGSRLQEEDVDLRVMIGFMDSPYLIIIPSKRSRDQPHLSHLPKERGGEIFRSNLLRCDLRTIQIICIDDQGLHTHSWVYLIFCNSEMATPMLLAFTAHDLTLGLEYSRGQLLSLSFISLLHVLLYRISIYFFCQL